MSKFLYLSQKKPHLPRIDGHAHIFMRHLPMPQNRRYTPSCDAPPAKYSKLLANAGLSGGLLVQPSFLGTDNRYLTETLRSWQGNALFFGVCVLPPTASRRQIAELANAGIVGARLNLIGRRTPNLNAKSWQDFMERIDEFGWHLEIQAEGYRLAKLLPQALAVCRRVVVDHFGLPEPTAPFKCTGWRTILSTKDRLWVKVSAPYRVFPNTQIDVAVEQCTLLAHTLQEHLGGNRIIWGSDWPWTRHETSMTFSRTESWREQWLKSDEDGTTSLLRDAIGNILTPNQ